MCRWWCEKPDQRCQIDEWVSSQFRNIFKTSKRHIDSDIVTYDKGVSSNFLLLSRNCLIPRKNSLRIPPYAIISNYMYINKVCAGVTNIDVYKNECRYFLVKRFTLKLNYPHFQNNYLQRKALILIAIEWVFTTKLKSTNFLIAPLTMISKL